jgi:hypothetical protein
MQLFIAGVSWFGLKQHRNGIASEQRRAAFEACKERGAALERRLESIKQDAHEQLTIGTKKERPAPPAMYILHFEGEVLETLCLEEC